MTLESRRGRRHHTGPEIEAKLQQAETMAREGRQNREIARALGVSVMTYQRWRRQARGRGAVGASDRAILAPSVVAAPATQPGVEGALGEMMRSVERFGAAPSESRTAVARRIEELERENNRLRRLVTDILLQKSEMEERLELVRASRS